jgi:anti-sigma28 factor (negative regulator of flagellin synthesis)
MPKIKNPKVAEIKKAIKNGTYDLEKAIESTTEKIVDYPQSLLWK